jgi:hypothetical protein
MAPPNVAKLENVWQGPYVVVNKQEEWHYCTLERNGKRRRSTAKQLRRYHKNEVESDVRFGRMRDVPENSELDVQAPPPRRRERYQEPPLNPHVIVQEITSSDDSESN